MARIVPITARRGLNTALGTMPRPSIDTAPQRAEIARGRAIQGAGRDLAAIGDEFAAIAQRSAAQKLENEEFRARQGFNRLNTDMGESFAEGEGQISESGEGFTDAAISNWNEKAAAFLETVPEALKPRYQELLRTQRAAWAGKAARRENQQRITWVRNGLDTSEDNRLQSISEDPDSAEAAIEAGLEEIRNAPALSPAEKAIRLQKWREISAQTRELAKVRNDPSYAQRYVGMSNPDAAAIIRREEGFRSTPYWDVNAQRAGYGSDTVTRLDGSVEKVTNETRVTREEAELDLARRIGEFTQRAAGQVGADAWTRLPQNVRAALISVTYNYGSLPKSVVAAAQGGDVETIAKTVEGLRSNPARRKREATIIRGGSIPAESTPEDLTFEASLQVRSEANRTVNRQNEEAERARQNAVKAADDIRKATITAEANAQKAARDQYMNDLKFRASDGRLDMGGLEKERSENDLNYTEYNQVRGIIEKRARDAGNNVAMAGLAQAIANNEGQINQFDPAQTETADNLYNALANQAAPEMAQQVEAEFAGATRYIPTAVRRDLRNDALSTDVNEFASAMQRANVLETVAPEHFRNFEGGKQIRSDLEAYKAARRQGYTPEQAARQVLEAKTSENVKASTQLLKSDDGKKWIANTSTENNIANLFDTAFTWQPKVGNAPVQTARIQAEYRSMLEQAFIQAGGDFERAEGIANERFKTIYGISQLTLEGDSVVVRLPLEKAYANILPEGTRIEDLQEQLRADMAEVEDFPEGGIAYLQSNDVTDADFEAGRPPGYDLFYYDEFERLQRRQEMWYPDMDALQAAAAQRSSEIEQEFRERRATSLDQKAFEQKADEAGQQAYEATIGPEWMKARAREMAYQRVLSGFSEEGPPPDVERGITERAEGHERRRRDLEQSFGGQKEVRDRFIELQETTGGRPEPREPSITQGGT